MEMKTDRTPWSISMQQLRLTKAHDGPPNRKLIYLDSHAPFNNTNTTAGEERIATEAVREIMNNENEAPETKTWHRTNGVAPPIDAHLCNGKDNSNKRVSTTQINYS